MTRKRRSFRPLDAKKKLLRKKLEQEGLQSTRESSRPAAIPRRPHPTEPAPLSFGQERLWFLDRLQPGLTTYLIPSPVRLSGRLRVAALVQTLDEILRRHEVLRTRFTQDEARDDRPVQHVEPPTPLAPQRVDLSELGPQDLDVESRRLVDAEARRPFDLGSGRLLRVALLRREPEEHVLTLTLHHVASDGASSGLLVHELTTLYQAFVEGRPSPLRPLPVQYADYAVWQRQRLAGEIGQEHLRWWRESLAGVPPVLDLPRDRPRPALPSHRGGLVRRRLPAATVEALDALGREHRASRFMVLMTALAAFLHRMTGRGDLLVGTPAGHRDRPELDGLIGFFVNTLALRLDVSGDPAFENLLDRVRRATLEAFEHQELPFEKLVDALGIERDTRCPPLIQVMLSTGAGSTGTPDTLPSLPGLKLAPQPFGVSGAKLDLLVHVTVGDGGLGLALEYATDLWDPTTVERFARELGLLLETAVERPETGVDRLPLLEPGPLHQVLREWGEARPVAPPAPTLAEAFGRVAQARPDAVAAVCGDRHLTYGALDGWSESIARRLCGVDLGTPVALCLDRGLSLPAALLGVLRAGGAYLPLDPEHPDARHAETSEDSRTRVLVTSDTILTERPRLQEAAERLGLEVIRLEDVPRASAPGSNEPSLPTAPPEAAAYVIYTSGSTGRPKGVVVSHGQVLRLFAVSPFAIGPGDVWTLFHSYAFDFSVWELWGALLFGGRLVIVPYLESRSPEDFRRLLMDERVTVLNQTPSAFRQLQAVDAAEASDRADLALRSIVFGGEALDLAGLAPWITRHGDGGNGSGGRGPRLINMYGITETTVHVTHRDVRREDAAPGAPSLVGRPLEDLRVHVLHPRSLEPQPPAAPGEMWVGGAGVARGYLHRPGLTAERFQPDPFPSNPGERLYRSGDLARRTARGELVYLGRLDQQVKVRGFRIELGEIEATLAAHPAVRDAVVTARDDDGPGNRRLVGYVVPGGESVPSFADLRTHAAGRLPSYMVPTAFVVLDELPLNANGKLDRDALPAPGSERPEPEDTWSAPQTEAETTLARIWAQVLRLDRVGRHDHFFELGGDSILSIQIVARARREGLSLRPQDVFLHPTVADLAHVASKRATPDRLPEQGPVTGPVPLTPMQRALVMDDPTELHWFNQALLLAGSKPLGPQWLAPAVDMLLDHHDVLRLRLRRGDWGWEQELVPPERAPTAIRTVDLSGLAPGDRGPTLEAAATRAQASLDLAHGPLLRAVRFRLVDDPARHPLPERLLLAIHHLAVDGVSWRILLEDLETARRDLTRGRPPSFPPKTSSFQAWAQVQEERSREREVTDELTYWIGVEVETPPPLPVDLAPGPHPQNTSRTITVPLPEEPTRDLLTEVPKAYRTGIDDVLLTALVRAMARWTGVPHLRVDLEGHGRDAHDGDLDLSRTVGWFTSLYPVQLSIDGVSEPGAALQAVKEQLRSVPGRGQGYGLLRYVNQELEQGGRLRRIAARQAGSQVSFNYLGQTGSGGGAETLGTDFWQPAEESSGTAQSPRRLRPHALAVSGAVAGGRLMMRFGYSTRAHREETMGRLAVSFRDELTQLIEHCRRSEVRGATPSDFPLAEIDQATVDRLFALHGPVDDVYPLSPLQEGMLFHTLAEPRRSFYFEQMTAVLEGNLDVEILQRALQRVVARHPVLRTAFVWDDVPHPLQVVVDEVTVPWRHLDWRDVSETERPRRLEILLTEDRRRGFDLTRAPLLRMTLVHLDDARRRLVWSWHHLLLDGWSVPRVVGELFSTYEALVRGEEPRLPRVRPYGDYVAWLARQDQQEAETFWKGLLQDVSEPTPLPVATSRAPQAASEAEDRRRDVLLPSDLTDALGTRARSLRVTLNTLIQGALAILLARHGGVRRVIFGATTSGRPTELAGVEEMVGMFINTLPLSVEVAPDRELGPWLREVQDVWTLARRFEYTPLARIQRWSGVADGTPLFQTLLVFENYPRGEALERKEGALRARDFESLERTNYPFTVVAAPGPRLALRLAWPAGRFEATAIQRVHGHLQALLTHMAHRSDGPVGRLSLLREGERHQILHEWSAATGPEPPAGDVVSTLLRIAEAQPDVVAVTTGETFLTYGELARRSRLLADSLEARGVGPEVSVAVRLPRSQEQIVGLVAVLRAGGVYLPLDPSYPAERLDFMAKDAGSPVEIVGDGPRGRAPASTHRTAIDAPERLAYLIYTSGSTGRPKGVGVSRGALANLCAWHADAFRVTPGTHAAQTAGLSFDASIAEILPYLQAGATLHLAPEHERLDPRALMDRWVREGVQIAFLPTPLAEAALELSWSRDAALRTMLTAGDRLRRRPAPGRPFHLVNNYGPTENAVASTFGLVASGASSDAGGWPSIGRPISGVRALVLDADLRPVPLGAPGELCLTGRSLARGYWGRPAVTAHAFVPHPFASEPGARMYRTGDRVRFLSDGRLDFLGRLDDQVQVRGVRVEPGEVEAVLVEHPAVTEAAVAPRQDAAGPRLVAWVTGRELPEAATLRAWLARRLPEPMLPAAFVPVEALPLTPGGKVDRRRLPDPEPAPERPKTAPRTEAEAALATIWAELLGVEEPGVEDDFFELGGDSILSIQVASRARRRGLELSPGKVFDHPTVAGQAAVARRLDAGAETARTLPTTESGPAPLTPIQRWFFEEHEETLAWFNQSVLLQPRQRLDAAVLDDALAHLTSRHEALRLRYRPDAMLDPPDGKPPSILSLVDLSSLPEDERGPALTSVATDVQAGFDPARGRVFQAVLFDLGSEQRLFLAAHHLAVDAVSWRLLLDDLGSLLDALETGTAPTLPPATPFRRWAHRLHALAASDDVTAELGFWTDPARRAAARLPVDGMDDPGHVGQARHLVIRLSAAHTRALRDAAPRVHRARLEDVLLAAWFRTVASWIRKTRNTGQDGPGEPVHLVVDLEGHGREEARVGLDASHTVGWLTSLHPVLLTSPDGDDPPRWVAAVRRDLRRVPGGGLGWGLLRYLAPDPEIRRTLAELPRPQMAFNYLGRLDAGFDAAGPSRGQTAGRWAPASEDTGPQASPRHRREHLLAVDAAVTGDRLGVRLTFSPRAHRADAMETLARYLRRTLEALAGNVQPASPLVCLAEAPEAPALVCVHAAAGRTRGYEPLARELQGDLAVWGCQARGLDGEAPREDVGDMAAAYLEAVEETLGDGPVALLGWSFGALVTAEMGRRIQAAGRSTPLLVVVDQEPELAPLPAGFDEVDWMLDLVGGDLPLDADELRALPDREDRLSRAFEAADAAGRLPPGLDRSQARRLFDVWLANHRAGALWRPAPYPGRILVFRAADQAHPEPDLGWEALAPGRVEVVELPGRHRGLLSGGPVRVLARHLRARFSHPVLAREGAS